MRRRGTKGQHVHLQAKLVAGVIGRRNFARSMPVKYTSFVSRSTTSESSRMHPAWAMASTTSTPASPESREVAIEELFVDGHVLDRHDAFSAFEFNDPIDQQEGIAVGQKVHDLPISIVWFLVWLSSVIYGSVADCCALRRKADYKWPTPAAFWHKTNSPQGALKAEFASPHL